MLHSLASSRLPGHGNGLPPRAGVTLRSRSLLGAAAAGQGDGDGIAEGRMR